MWNIFKKDIRNSEFRWEYKKAIAEEILWTHWAEISPNFKRILNEVIKSGYFDKEWLWNEEVNAKFKKFMYFLLWKNKIKSIRREYFKYGRSIIKNKKSELENKALKKIREKRENIFSDNKIIEILYCIENSEYKIEQIKNFEGLDDNTQYEIYLKAFENKWIEAISSINIYKIRNEWVRFEIAKELLNIDANILCSYLNNFEIYNEEYKYKLAYSLSKTNPEILAFFIKNFEISEQKNLIKIAKILAFENAASICLWMENFWIKDENDRIQIAKICAYQNWEKTSRYINNFKIQKKERLLEIAKIAAAQFGSWTSYYVQNYKIEDEEDRFEVAKIALNQNWLWSSCWIMNYWIKSIDKKLILAWIALRENLESFVNMEKFFIWLENIEFKNIRTSEDFLLEIEKNLNSLIQSWRFSNEKFKILKLYWNYSRFENIKFLFIEMLLSKDIELNFYENLLANKVKENKVKENNKIDTNKTEEDDNEIINKDKDKDKENVQISYEKKQVIYFMEYIWFKKEFIYEFLLTLNKHSKNTVDDLLWYCIKIKNKVWDNFFSRININTNLINSKKIKNLINFFKTVNEIIDISWNLSQENNINLVENLFGLFFDFIVYKNRWANYQSELIEKTKNGNIQETISSELNEIISQNNNDSNDSFGDINKWVVLEKDISEYVKRSRLEIINLLRLERWLDWFNETQEENSEYFWYSHKPLNNDVWLSINIDEKEYGERIFQYCYNRLKQKWFTEKNIILTEVEIIENSWLDPALWIEKYAELYRIIIEERVQKELEIYYENISDWIRTFNKCCWENKHQNCENDDTINENEYIVNWDITVKQKLELWEDFLFNWCLSYELNDNNIKTINKIVEEIFFLYFEIVFRLKGKSINKEDLENIINIWWDISVLYSLFARYSWNIAWQKEIPILSKIVEIILEWWQSSFRKFKYLWVWWSEFDAIQSRNQLIWLSKEQLKLWASNPYRISSSENSSSKIIYDESILKDTRLMFSSMFFVKLWLNSINPLATEKLIKANSRIISMKDNENILIPCEEEIEIIRDAILWSNIKEIHAQLWIFWYNIDLNKKQVWEKLLIALIVIWKNSKNINELKKIIKLIKSWIPWIDISWIKKQLDNILNEINTREKEKDYIVFTTIFDDAKMLLEIWNLVDTYSCQNYINWENIDTILWYVIDANIKWIATFIIGSKELNWDKKKLEEIKSIIASWKYSIKFNPSKRILTINWIEINLNKASLRRILKLWTTENWEAWVYVEQKYSSTNKINDIIELENWLLLQNFLKSIWIKQLKFWLKLAASKNPWWVYSDASWWVKKTDYRV